MKAKLIFLPVTCSILLATACHHKRVTMSLDCTSKPCSIKTKPPTVHVKGDSGTFTLTWKPANSAPWLVDFPDKSPCKAGTIVQSGGTENCVIDISKMDQPCYKYIAISAEAISADPGIAHDVRQKPPPVCLSTTSKAALSSPLTAHSGFFCLNLTGGSPASCNNGYPPLSSAEADPLQNVSPANYINWRLNSGSTINIDKGACDQGTSISAAQGICKVSKTAGNCGSDPCTYGYTLNGSGTTFHIQVRKMP